MNETSISVTHLPYNTRRAIAKKFGLTLHWEVIFGRKHWSIVIPGRLCGWTLEREVEAAVRAAE